MYDVVAEKEGQVVAESRFGTLFNFSPIFILTHMLPLRTPHTRKNRAFGRSISGLLFTVGFQIAIPDFVFFSFLFRKADEIIRFKFFSEKIDLFSSLIQNRVSTGNHRTFVFITRGIGVIIRAVKKWLGAILFTVQIGQQGKHIRRIIFIHGCIRIGADDNHRIRCITQQDDREKGNNQV